LLASLQPTIGVGLRSVIGARLAAAIFLISLQEAFFSTLPA
jgi:hypothetical protein